MKNWKKGFTLVELLAVIVVLAIVILIIRPQIQDIIMNAKYKSSKESIQGYIREANIKSTTSFLSDNGIKINSEKYTFETGADEDDLAKIKLSGNYPRYSYIEYNQSGEVIYGKFCINGYSIIYNRGTYSNSSENFCTDEYISTPTVTINSEQNTISTSGANIKFTVQDKYTITGTTCSYGETSLYGSSGTITGTTCKIEGLQKNRMYYVKICATNNKGKKGCRSDYFITNNMNRPVLTYTNTPGTSQNGYYKKQVIAVTSTKGNITNPENYIRTTRAAKLSANTQATCGTGSIPTNCTTLATKNIEANTWYKVPMTVNVTYDVNSIKEDELTALLSDGVDYTNFSTAKVAKIDVEAPTVSISSVSPTSNSLRINYELHDGKSGVNAFTCKYGTSDGVYGTTVTSATSTSCTLVNLSITSTYYYQICATDKLGNSDCKTGSAKTSSIVAPVISYENIPQDAEDGFLKKQIVKIAYSNINVTNPNYYVKTTKEGTVESGVVSKACGTSDKPGTCSNSTVTKLAANTWYKVNGNVNITYTANSEVTTDLVYALVYDGAQYSDATTANLSKIDAENPTVTLGVVTPQTNSIVINYVLNDSKSGVGKYTCKYGDAQGIYNMSSSSATSTVCTLTELQNNKVYYYQVCVSDKVGNGPICAEGNIRTANFVNPSIALTNTPVGLTYVAKGTNDTHKGIIYMDPSNLATKCTASSTLTGGSTGCKKFYIFDDSGDTYKMIMYRNIGNDNVTWLIKSDYLAAGGTEADWGSQGDNSKGPITAMKAMNEKTTGWVGNPRMITADEIAHIVGADLSTTIKWSSSKPYGTSINTQSSWFYLDGTGTSYSSTDGWQKQVATSQGESRYAWLFDYSTSCLSRGCNYEINFDSTGYLTFNGLLGDGQWSYKEYIWTVNHEGKLTAWGTASGGKGIRPVLEIPKTLVTRNNYLKKQVAAVTYNNSNVGTPVYYIMSTRAAKTNNNTIQSCGLESAPQNCVSSSTKSIAAGTWYKVNGNINVTYDTNSSEEATLYALTYDGDNYSGSATSAISKIDVEESSITLRGVTRTTNSAIINYTIEDIKSGLGSYTCKYGTVSGTYDKLGSSVSTSSCVLSNLTNNTTYYYQICVTDAAGNGPTCKESSFDTQEFNPVTIGYDNTPGQPRNDYLKNQVLKVVYNNDNVANPVYYIKSTRAGVTSSNTIAACGTTNSPGSCSTSAVTTLVANTWYKVSGNINVTYNSTNATAGTLYALIYDGYNYSGSATSEIAKIDRENPVITLGNKSSTTNSINIEYTLADTKSGVGLYTCMYSDTAGVYDIEASTVTDVLCSFGGLAKNKTYYYEICLYDKVGNGAVCEHDSISTQDFIDPIITLNNTPTTAINNYLRKQVADVDFDSTNVSNPKYYIKSTRAGVSSVTTISYCGTGDTPSATCTASAVTSLTANRWYLVPSDLSITYAANATSTHKLYALIYDGNNLSGKSEKTISRIEAGTPTAPVIAGGGDSWITTSPVTVSVTTAGTATSTVDKYEYYKSTSSATPDSTVTVTGTTTGNLSVTDEGTTYIWYRTLSKAGNRSVWSNMVTINLDSHAPSTPTLTYISGRNASVWQNDIQIRVTGPDQTPGSGLSYYEYDSGANGSVDGTTQEVFTPTNGHNGQIKFRGVDIAGNAGSYSSSVTVMYDNEAPVVTNAWFDSTVTYKKATLYVQVTDNASGLPNTAETYDGHRSGVYCPTSTATGEYNNWHWFEATWDASKSAYKCEITTSTFEHYDQDYAIHVYVYDRAGNGGIYEQMSIHIPYKDYLATESCSSGTHQNGSCYFASNQSMCGCAAWNQKCIGYEQVCNGYEQVCSEYNYTCSSYTTTCTVSAPTNGHYTCDSCTATGEVSCKTRSTSPQGWIYVMAPCTCTRKCANTVQNGCKTYTDGACNSWTNGSCNAWGDDTSSCKTASSCYKPEYLTYSCPDGGEVVGKMCIREV